MDRQLGIDHQHQSEAAHARDRHEVIHHVVVDFVQERIGGQRRIGPHQQRVAVGRLVMHVLRRHRAVGDGPILDHHGWPSALLKGSAMMRQMVSLALPGPNTATMVIGRDG